MKRVLEPIRHRDAYTVAIEREIRRYLEEAIFTPLADVLAEHGVSDRLNAQTSVLERALQAGVIWYADGVFSGRFSAAVSRQLRDLGAKFDRKQGVFKLPAHQMPIELKSIVTQSLMKSQAAHAAVIATLNAIEQNIPIAPTGIGPTPAVKKIVTDLDEQFNVTITTVVEIPMVIPPGMRERLTTTLTDNVELSIKNWATETVSKLRRDVEKNAAAGYRADRLTDLIQAKYGMGKRKAAFLAENETSLLVSKYREERYKAAGSRRYKWSTSKDEVVRDEHRALDGTIHEWDSPPITNRARGDRNHPGEDFRCRCLALPIVEIPE